MSRDRDPSCKRCRRSGQKLLLKGNRCHTAKCAIEKRNFPPGSNPGARAVKQTEYGRRLREKQKLRFFYGVTETQVQNYFDKALKQKGVTGYNLLSSFERRLDNVVFRMGFAQSRQQARQVVRHRKIFVNSRKIDIPSYLLREGDVVSFVSPDGVYEKKRLDEVKAESFVGWLSFDLSKKAGRVDRLPERDEIDTPVEEQLIVEYYSR